MATTSNWEDARDRLRKLRETQSRKSEEVIELWTEILEDFSYKLGDEVWLIHEQVFVAACDCGRIDVSETCLEALNHQFPGSQRVAKLKGMMAESMGRYDHAIALYQRILEKDENNSIVQKRLIACKKAQNKPSEVIKDLTNYLKSYQSDYEAWSELCDLYISEMDYSKAAFCMEELILSNPHNHLYMQKYAEIKYTQGGYDNMEMARMYFARSHKLNTSNMRSLFGMFMAASFLASNTRSNAKDRKENIKYAAWAAELIAQKYKAHSSKDNDQHVKSLTGMLDTLQITQSGS